MIRQYFQCLLNWDCHTLAHRESSPYIEKVTAKLKDKYITLENVDSTPNTAIKVTWCRLHCLRGQICFDVDGNC